MRKRKRLHIYLEKSLWCLPVIILILGSVPAVKESIWWTSIGFFLFAGIMIISIHAWFGLGHKVELEKEHEQEVLLQANDDHSDLKTKLLRQYY